MTARKIDNEFTGKIEFRIKGQAALPKYDQKFRAKMFRDGQGATNDLRFTCRIAEDANDIFERLEVDGDVLTINPKAKSQFGRNARGLAYLTVGMIRESDQKRICFTWEGEAVPRKMQEVAVKHDEGKRVAATTVHLDLAQASVAIAQSTVGDPRTAAIGRKADARYRERKRAGKVRSRHHDRLCRADLEAVSA